MALVFVAPDIAGAVQSAWQHPFTFTTQLLTPAGKNTQLQLERVRNHRRGVVRLLRELESICISAHNMVKMTLMTRTVQLAFPRLPRAIDDMIVQFLLQPKRRLTLEGVLIADPPFTIRASRRSSSQDQWRATVAELWRRELRLVVAIMIAAGRVQGVISNMQAMLARWRWSW